MKREYHRDRHGVAINVANANGVTVTKEKVEEQKLADRQKPKRRPIKA